MHTWCIIWNVKASLGQVLSSFIQNMLSAFTRHILAKHNLYANFRDLMLCFNLEPSWMYSKANKFSSLDSQILSVFPYCFSSSKKKPNIILHLCKICFHIKSYWWGPKKCHWGHKPNSYKMFNLSTGEHQFPIRLSIILLFCLTLEGYPDDCWTSSFLKESSHSFFSFATVQSYPGNKFHKTQWDFWVNVLLFCSVLEASC